MVNVYCDECGKFMKIPYYEEDYGIYWCKKCYEKKYGESDEQDEEMWGDDGRYNMGLED